MVTLKDNIVMARTQPIAHLGSDTGQLRCSFSGHRLEFGIFQNREVLSVVELVRLEPANDKIHAVGANPPSIALALLNDKSLHSSLFWDFGCKGKQKLLN